MSRQIYTLLATLIPLLSPSLQASAAWENNIELFFAASDDASTTGVRGLFPLKQDGQSLYYLDARYLDSDKSTAEVNLGGGYRKINVNEDKIWGGYAALDTRQSASSRTHVQLTLGGEMLTDTWDYRSNIYLPIKGDFVVAKADDKLIPDSEFTGFSFTRTVTTIIGGEITEESLQGFELEAGRLIPNSDDMELRAYIAAYNYSADTIGSTSGLRLRLEAHPTENFRVDFSVEDDDIYDTRSILQFSLKLGKKPRTRGIRDLGQRMTQFVVRDIDIRETSRLNETKRTKNSDLPPIVGDPVVVATDVVHIDNKAAANGDGSAERPFNSIAACQAGNNQATARGCSSAQAANSKVLFIHQGNSVVSDAEGTGAADNQDAAIPYIGNLTLSPGQKLIGDGAVNSDFSDIVSKNSPVLIGADGAAENFIISATDNNSIEGIKLGWHYGFNAVEAAKETPSMTFTPLPAGGKMPEMAIYAQDAKNFTANNITITGYSSAVPSGAYSEANNFSTGIFAQATPGNKSDALIRNLSIDSVLGDAILIEAQGNAANIDKETATKQTFVVSGVNLLRNGRGIRVVAKDLAVGNAYIDQDISIIPLRTSSATLANAIQQNFNEGILIESSGLTASTLPAAFHTIAIDSTQIQDNQGAGVLASLQQPVNRSSTVTINNSNIYQNEGGGVALLSDGGSSSLQLTGSNIIGNIDKPDNIIGASDFGQRLDKTAIDCQESGSCGPLQANPSRVIFNGFGIYARNKDSLGISNQSITIDGSYAYTLHSPNAAQIYMLSDISNNNSLQSLNVIKASDSTVTQAIQDTAGQVIVSGGSAVVTPTDVANSTSPQLIHCDGSIDGATPNQAFIGEAVTHNTQAEQCL